jgi:hypothetical protein
MDKDIPEVMDDTNVVATDESKGSTEAPPEKMLPVSRVNELIKKAKWDGEKKMQEQLEQAKQQIEQLQGQQAQQPVQQQGASQGQQQQPQQMSPEQLQQIMQMMQQKQQEDEAARHQEQLQREVDEVARQYYGKMAQGKELYEDFEAIASKFDPAAFPQLVFLANQSDNTAAIIYELQKNPSKLAALQVLVERSPNMARDELAKLSQSIKTNLDAKANAQNAKEPLDRLKPSPTGTDNGARTVRDYKNSSFLRG